ncbi:hypothetical protein [Acaryochloris thomasi]|uniref:hypothetical protein n=1 Tax=Acaryochloris thomasi TaxID=2929456 RepID=UPI0011B363C5|nr:hypothetical protein [Acaryochloris thomasi]
MTGLCKLPQCFDCRYHYLTGHLVCAIHPSGPIGDRCAEFVAMAEGRSETIAEVAAYGEGACSNRAGDSASY